MDIGALLAQSPLAWINLAGSPDQQVNIAGPHLKEWKEYVLGFKFNVLISTPLNIWNCLLVTGTTP